MWTNNFLVIYKTFLCFNSQAVSRDLKLEYLKLSQPSGWVGERSEKGQNLYY
jgi:hypothetical protein